MYLLLSLLLLLHWSVQKEVGVQEVGLDAHRRLLLRILTYHINALY
jgi:hypothetical protein